jgi:hypothetical protein
MAETADQKMWKLWKEMRELVIAQHPIIDDSKDEKPRPFMDPDYGCQFQEHLEAKGTARIRVLRMKNGATKIVIIDEQWLKTTHGRE